MKHNWINKHEEHIENKLCYKSSIEKEEHKQKLPYWFETKEWKEFSKLADTHFGGKPKSI